MWQFPGYVQGTLGRSMLPWGRHLNSGDGQAVVNLESPRFGIKLDSFHERGQDLAQLLRSEPVLFPIHQVEQLWVCSPQFHPVAESNLIRSFADRQLDLSAALESDYFFD